MDGSFPPPRNLGGRPPFVPSRDQRDMVRIMVANGVAHRIIAEVLDINLTTLKKACKAELASGFERVKAAIGAAVVKSAMSGNISAQKYWLMTRGGEEWRLPKDADPATVAAMLGNDTDEPWVIMMPENGRDEPEEDEPPTIDGTAEEAA